MQYDDAVRLLDVTCPHCQQAIKGSVTVGGEWPGNGDVTICTSCLSPGVYDSGPMGLFLRQPTPAEAAEILADPMFTRIRDALRSSGSAREAFDQLKGDE